MLIDLQRRHFFIFKLFHFGDKTPKLSPKCSLNCATVAKMSPKYFFVEVLAIIVDFGDTLTLIGDILAMFADTLLSFGDDLWKKNCLGTYIFCCKHTTS